MSNYTPPDPHSVNLNFKDPITGSTDLNFGVDEQNLASLDAVIYTGFIAELHAESYSNDILDVQVNTGFIAEISGITGQFAQLDTMFQTGFIAELNAVRIDQYCAVDTIINTRFKADIDALFDINFIRGVEAHWVAEYQRAKPCLIAPEIRWGKPIFKAHNSAFYFERSLSISNQASIGFDKANTLHRAVQIIHEQTTGLSRSAYLKWQENERLFISRSLVFDESNKLTINQNMDWVELVRKRKTFIYSHQVAHVFEKHFTFDGIKGLSSSQPVQSHGIKPSRFTIENMKFSLGQSLNCLNILAQPISISYVFVMMWIRITLY